MSAGKLRPQCVNKGAYSTSHELFTLLALCFYSAVVWYLSITRIEFWVTQLAMGPLYKYPFVFQAIFNNVGNGNESQPNCKPVGIMYFLYNLRIYICARIPVIGNYIKYGSISHVCQSQLKHTSSLYPGTTITYKLVFIRW